MHPWDCLSLERPQCARQRESLHHKDIFHERASYVRANITAPILRVPTMSAYCEKRLYHESAHLENIHYKRIIYD